LTGKHLILQVHCNYLLYIRIPPAKIEKAKQVRHQGANYKSELMFISYILHLESSFRNQILSFNGDETQRNTMLNGINAKKVDYIRVWKKGLSKDSGRIFSKLVSDVYKTELEDLSEPHDIANNDNVNGNGIEITSGNDNHDQEISVESPELEQNIQAESVESDLMTEQISEEHSQPKKKTKYDWEESDDEDDTQNFRLDMLESAPITDLRTKYTNYDKVPDHFTEVLLSNDMSSEFYNLTNWFYFVCIPLIGFHSCRYF
jgi:hypothetical protein